MGEVKLNNTFKTSFILNKSKLIRINDVLDKQFQKIISGNLEVDYLVKFNNGKEANLSNINEVFNLDNGIKNRITGLKITYKKDDHIAIINFDGDRRVPQISILVEGGKTEWTNECFAEIEEQTERTKETGWIFELKKSSSLNLITTIGILAAFIPIILGGSTFLNNNIPEVLKTEALQRDTLKKELIEKVKTVNTTDEKIDLLIEINRIFILDDYGEKVAVNKPLKPNALISLIKNWKFYLVAVPILILIGILFYLVKYCYWLHGFIWGDMEEDYKKMQDRRKTLWGILIGSLFLGILSNLFVFGLTELI